MRNALGLASCRRVPGAGVPGAGLVGSVGVEPRVTGTVRLDGRLLPRGSIAWIPVHGTPGPGGGGGISKEGKYEVNQGLRPGKYRVEIRSTITSGRKVLNPTVPNELIYEEVSVIPEEYNSKSNLIREVRPGPNVCDFPLISIKVAARR